MGLLNMLMEKLSYQSLLDKVITVGILFLTLVVLIWFLVYLKRRIELAIIGDSDEDDVNE